MEAAVSAGTTRSLPNCSAGSSRTPGRTPRGGRFTPREASYNSWTSSSLALVPDFCPRRAMATLSCSCRQALHSRRSLLRLAEVTLPRPAITTCRQGFARQTGSPHKGRLSSKTPRGGCGSCGCGCGCGGGGGGCGGGCCCFGRGHSLRSPCRLHRSVNCAMQELNVQVDGARNMPQNTAKYPCQVTWD